MINLENKVFFNNIKNFRNIICESINDNDMSKYIENHEYVYIYYVGDENNKMGYRTIRPYVLGVSKSGNKVIRAWQDNKKNSFSFVNKPTRPDSNEHDYWVDNDGIKPGWRMFRLDKITKAYPTGKRFHKTDGSVMIPPKYNEGGDKDMVSIITYISSKSEPSVTTKPDELPIVNKKINKWDKFTKGDKNNRKITADDVIKLRNIASRVYKKSIGRFLVVINNNNDFDIIDINDKSKVPQNAIVGNLPNLYDTLVKSAPVDDKFFKDKSNSVKFNVNKK